MKKWNSIVAPHDDNHGVFIIDDPNDWTEPEVLADALHEDIFGHLAIGLYGVETMCFMINIIDADHVSVLDPRGGTYITRFDYGTEQVTYPEPLSYEALEKMITEEQRKLSEVAPGPDEE